MPVLRKREELNAQAGMRPVTMRPLEGANRAGAMLNTASASLNDLSRITGVLTRRAAAFGEAMVTASEEEAMALTKKAVFTTGPNGGVLKPELKTRLSEVAQRTYDRVMEERYINQMQTAMRQQIMDARNSNMDDLDAFIADAEGRMAQMALDVPPGYEGVFQQLSTGMMVETGASIGYQQAQMRRQADRANVVYEVENLMNGVQGQLWASDDDAATLSMQATLDYIDQQPEGVMSTAEKHTARLDAYYRWGVTRLMRDLRLGDDNTDPDLLMEVSSSLRKGDDPQLMEYFIRPGSTVPDRDLAMRAASELAQLTWEANARASERTRQVTEQTAVNRMLAGGSQDTQENKARLDAIVAKEIGAEGDLMPDDWLMMDPRSRARAIQRVKEIGYTSSSLDALFRDLEGETDGDRLTAGYMIWRDLKHQQNARGAVVDMSGVAGPRMGAIFERAEALNAGGRYDLAAREAVKMAETLRMQDETGSWTDQELANRLNNRLAGSVVDYLFRQNVTPETARAALGRAVDRHIFDDLGIAPTAQEREQTVAMVETFLRTGESLDRSFEYARQGIDGRFKEERGMGGVRSSQGPERNYPNIPAANFDQLFDSFLDLAEGSARRVAEVFANAPNALIPNFVYTYDATFASDFKLASDFEKIAHPMIARMIEESGLDRTETMSVNADGVPIVNSGPFGGRMLRLGRDYMVTPAGQGANGKPIYSVILMDGTGANIPLEGRLDVSGEYKKLEMLNTILPAFDSARQEMGEAQALEQFKGDPDAYAFLKFILESEP